MADNTTLNSMTGGDVIASDDIAGVKYQRVKVGAGVEGSFTDVTTLSDGSTGVGLGVAMMATNFVHSTNNSSTAQLAAAATFTGVVETVFNQQTASVLLTSDQNGTLTLKQYIDSGGTRLISSWVFTVTASVPFSRSLTLNGNYFNLTYQNTGGSTTTTLNIDTAYGTLPPVTNLGNSPIAVNEVNGVAVTGGSVPHINVPIAQRTAMAYGTLAAGATAGTSGTEAMLVMGQQFQAGTSQATTGTSITVPAGKTFRVQSMTVVVKANAATVASGVVSLRYNPGGAAVIGSAPYFVLAAATPAVSGQANSSTAQFGDGIDLAASGQFGFSVLPTWTTTAATVWAFITGYLY